jgi:hypothetical protein
VLICDLATIQEDNRSAKEHFQTLYAEDSSQTGGTTEKKSGQPIWPESHLLH